MSFKSKGGVKSPAGFLFDKGKALGIWCVTVVIDYKTLVTMLPEAQKTTKKRIV